MLVFFLPLSVQLVCRVLNQQTQKCPQAQNQSQHCSITEDSYKCKSIATINVDNEQIKRNWNKEFLQKSPPCSSLIKWVLHLYCKQFGVIWRKLLASEWSKLVCIFLRQPVTPTWWQNEIMSALPRLGNWSFAAGDGKSPLGKFIGDKDKVHLIFDKI